jgi:tetratricopeptide (TPR) repeat protein
MNRRERRAAGKGSKITLNTATANTPAALHEAGLQHFRAGRPLDAQICCQQALALDAEHAGTLHLMGLLSIHAKQYDHAVEWISRAIRQQPKTEYLTSLGTTLLNQGRREEALKTFDKAVQLSPNDADVWRNLANILADMERPADAILSYRQALKLNTRHWDAAHQCGYLLHRLGRFEEALIHFNLCDELQPNHAATLQMRALARYGLDRIEEALADIRRAHALDPASADICNNLGVFLRRLGREEEALPWFDRARERRPNFLAAFVNKAFALTQIHRFAEAFAVYEEMKVVDPGNAEAEYDMSLLHLLTGNFEAGWAGLEARSKVPSLSIARFEFPQPRWLGKEPIGGKTILLHADEGLGDSIQFVRYVPMVAALGARVILVVENAMYPLLSGLTGVSQCLPKSAGSLPAFDLYCPMTSLPLAFGTRLQTIPSATPYLPAPAESRLQTWEGRLGSHDRLRVGLVWSGNPKHSNDRNRSIPLRALAGILDVGATFVSLQKDPRPDDKAILLERSEIIDLTADLTDFAETAALASCLDLVITVDTSVAHLAGALGRPTWILLPYTPDYRWLLDRDDSPWYPTVRLFRQDATRDYAGVIDRVRSALLAMISEFEPDQSQRESGSD